MVNVLQSDYPKLYAAISNIYGTPTGDNAANEFLLPDFRGRFIRGWDNMAQEGESTTAAGNDLSANREFGSIQEDDNKEHNHSGNTGDNGAHSHTFYMKADYCETGKRYGYCNHRAPNEAVVGNANFTTAVGDHNHTIDNDGTESRPKNIAILICIKY